MAEGVQQSTTNGVRQQPPVRKVDDVEFVPGGSVGSTPEPEAPEDVPAAPQSPAE